MYSVAPFLAAQTSPRYEVIIVYGETVPALAITSPKRVIWAQGIFSVVIYNSKKNFGPQEQFLGVRFARGGTVRMVL